ncbi:MAG: ABC transporter permease [Microthrixaceae bacterium]
MTGAVYDRGYRPYEGARGGRRAARTALFRASIRRALGMRREWRQKVAPFVLLTMAVVPAIVNVGVKYLSRNTPARDLEFITYRDYVGVSNTLLVFVAVTAPDIMCPDRRQRVLPLVFARPLKGVDYVIAKLATMAAILFAFSFIPQVILFVGQMLVSNDGALRYARDNAEVIWQVPAAVALLALFYAAIGVAVSSLTSRRIIAGATIIGLFLVTSIVSSILVGPEGGEVRTQSAPVTSVLETPSGPVVQVVPGPASTDTYYVVEDQPSAAPLLNLAGLPLVLRDIVFLGEIDPSHPMSGVDGGGLLAVVVFAFVVVVCVGILLRRYNEVDG